MNSLVEFVVYMIASAGITNIAVYGSIFNRIRPKKGKLGELFHCPMCLGTWVGFALCGLSGWTEFFNIEPTLMNYALCGAISSLASYAFAMVVDDEGLRISRNCPDCTRAFSGISSLEGLGFAHESQLKETQGGGDDQQ